VKERALATVTVEQTDEGFVVVLSTDRGARPRLSPRASPTACCALPGRLASRIGRVHCVFDRTSP
jgi:hypothetical protein